MIENAAPAIGMRDSPPLRRRLLSMTYEAMLLFAVVFIAGYLFDTLTQSRDALMLRHTRQAWLFVVLGIYFVWFWTHGGQTLAMKTWRIRVIDVDGRGRWRCWPCSTSAAGQRWRHSARRCCCRRSMRCSTAIGDSSTIASPARDSSRRTQPTDRVDAVHPAIATMIERLMRMLWLATAAVAVAAASWSVHLFASRIGPWAAACAAVFVVAAMHPLVVAINFCLSRVAGDRVPHAHRLTLWQAIRTFDAEIDASMRGLWFATPFLAHRPLAEPVAERSRPLAILFVHGYLCNRAVWLSFARDAASRGYRCQALTLQDPFASIDHHVAQVDAAIDTLSAHRSTGDAATRVVIVAHSMGGLVARAALRRIDASRVAHVVTLGTPHHGCLSARLARFPSVVQMRRHGPWLTALAADEAASCDGLPRSAYTTLFSYHDEIVYPQETGRLDGAHAIAIGGCGHVALLYDRRVRSLVFDRLATLEAASASDVQTAIDDAPVVAS